MYWSPDIILNCQNIFAYCSYYSETKNGIVPGWVARYLRAREGISDSTETRVSIRNARLIVFWISCCETSLISLSRLEKHLAPSSESTKLEASGGFIEYVGANKLKDKKVLITGGEYGARSGIWSFFFYPLGSVANIVFFFREFRKVPGLVDLLLYWWPAREPT